MPRRALWLSVAALLAPLAANFLLPEWLGSEGALLAWLPAVLPAFLLAYYRGWHGASLALAGAMAALALSQVEVLLLELPPPPWEVLMAVVAVLLSVTLGAGWMAERLHSERSAAERAAFEDPLTGLPNRRHASMVLEAAWTRHRTGGLAVVLFDLDRFKEVNRTHGHLEGDQVLAAFGRVLAAETGPDDISARWGGEEFLTLLEEGTMDDAAAFAEAVRARLAELDSPWGPLTVSAGVSAVEPGMGSPDVLLAAADRALHQAKELGRDQVRRADQPVVGTSGVPGRPNGERLPGEAPGPASLEGLRVLLADDDPDVLASTARLLERLGCTVRAVADPHEAVRVFTEEEPPQVIVTDIIMPGMSGFTLVDLASRVVPDLPALYISGYPQEEVYWGGSPGARSVFLAKPLEMARLRRALNRLLGVEEGADAPGAPAPGAAGPGPTGSAALSAGRSERASAPDERTGRILVLDNEERVVATLQRLFERTGYPEPIGLTDPHQLADVLARQRVDLLLLDLHMPGKDGFEILEELPGLLREGEYLPVLVLTGDDHPDLRRKALAAGAHDFLRKPFDVAEAQARVQSLLETRFLNQRVARQRDEMEDRVRARTAELADTRTEILHRLARAAEYRDDITGRHAERVGLLASLLAGEMGLPHREVDILRRTAPLHDIGKIGVPDAILRKPGELTPSEFELMKTHTLIGEEILGGGRHQILKTAAEIALSHHERWDGAGYPHGLVGADIPISARLVSVADTFDTLSHNRPYKNAHPVHEVVAEIRRCRGGQFDPAVVDAFNALCERVGPERFTRLADPLDPRRDIYTVHER